MVSRITAAIVSWLAWSSCSLAQPSPIDAIIPAEAPKPPPPIWSGGVEFGFNGAEGNSQLFKTRFAANAKYDTPEHVWTGNLTYNYTTAMGALTENRLLTGSRYERNFVGTPWLAFVSGTLEYDEFRAFPILLTAHTGVGYYFLKDDYTFLKGRAGFGGSQTINGPDDTFNPEALLGLDYERKFSAKNKFVASATYYPGLDDIGQYRIEANAAVEMMLSDEYNLALKLGINDRYFSRPQGKKPNDFEYFGAVLWKF